MIETGPTPIETLFRCFNVMGEKQLLFPCLNIGLVIVFSCSFLLNQAGTNMIPALTLIEIIFSQAVICMPLYRYPLPLLYQLLADLTCITGVLVMEHQR
jgi:hypothetical protein